MWVSQFCNFLGHSWNIVKCLWKTVPTCVGAWVFACVCVRSPESKGSDMKKQGARGRIDGTGQRRPIYVVMWTYLQLQNSYSYTFGNGKVAKPKTTQGHDITCHEYITWLNHLISSHVMFSLRGVPKCVYLPVQNLGVLSVNRCGCPARIQFFMYGIKLVVDFWCTTMKLHMWFQPTAKWFSTGGKSERKNIHIKERAVTKCVEDLFLPSHRPLAFVSTTANEHTSFVCNSSNSNYDYHLFGGMDVRAKRKNPISQCQCGNTSLEAWELGKNWRAPP